MDFVTSLSLVKGLSAIIVVIDRLSKYSHPLPASYMASSVANYFIKQVVQLHGVSKTVVSDRDKILLSKFWREIFT